MGSAREGESEKRMRSLTEMAGSAFNIPEVHFTILNL